MRWQYRHSGSADHDAQRAAMADFGLSAEQIARALPAPQSAAVTLLPLALPVWQVWQDMDTQWDVSDGVVLGLNACKLEAVHRQRGTPRRAQRDMWPLLKAMEREALSLMRDRG